MIPIIQKVLKKTLLSLFICISLILISGYTFTYYKEHIHLYVVPSSVKSVMTLYGTTTYLNYGDSNNTPIVLLHGTGANAFIFEKTSLFLSEKGYYVIVPDIPPFGFTTIREQTSYTKDIQAKKIIALLDILSIKKPIVLGHSFNAKVALQIAEQGEVKKLILVAPVFDYKKVNTTDCSNTDCLEKESPKSFFPLLFSITPLRDSTLSLLVNNPLFAKKILLSFMYKKDINIDEVTEKMILPFNKEGANHAYGLWFKEFFTETSTTSDTQALSQITIPIAVLWGDKDTVAPISNFDILHSFAKDATLITLPNVGHMPHLEDVETFDKELLNALNNRDVGK